jgi:hypothetical protein
MSIANHRRVITKSLVSTAIALGFLVGGAAPASADTNSTGANPNPFSTLSCSCRETTPAGSPGRKEEIERGIGEGRAAGSPGLPAPGQPR